MDRIAEKRRHERSNVVRGAKVYDPRGDRYLPARTRDASKGGLFLVVHGGHSLPIGAPVKIAVNWADRGELVGQQDMVEARVTRHAGRFGDDCLIGVAYEKADVATTRQAA